MDESICNIHGKKGLVLPSEDPTQNKYICRICIFKSKQDIDFYYENYDKFEKTEDVKLNLYEQKLKDYEGFSLVNKNFVEAAKSFNLDDPLYSRLFTNKERFKTEMKEGLKHLYGKITEKFENTVNELNEKADTLDLTLKSAKDDLEKIQVELDEQINTLESKEKVDEQLEKIEKKLYAKFKYMPTSKLIDPELKITFGKGQGNTNLMNGTNFIIAQRRNTGSYWRERSDEIFDGAMFARIKVHNISRRSDWSLNIGLQRANSNNDNSYYMDGVFFMCSGKITNQFQGNVGRNMHSAWNNGDEILISRDENNNVLFGLNDESTLTQAYANITGPFRICIGFSSACNGDHIELLEVEN